MLKFSVNVKMWDGKKNWLYGIRLVTRSRFLKPFRQQIYGFSYWKVKISVWFKIYFKFIFIVLRHIRIVNNTLPFILLTLLSNGLCLKIELKSISFKKIPKTSDLPKIVRTLPPIFFVVLRVISLYFRQDIFELTSLAQSLVGKGRV